MEIVDLNIRKYDVGLVEPLTINGQTICRREGVIIFLADADGPVGCGEVAPLPGLGRESLDEAISQLKGLEEEILGLQIGAGQFEFAGQLKGLLGADLFGSVRLGIEMAIFNLLRQSGDIVINSKGSSVAVNGLAGAGVDLFGEVDRLLGQGCATIKIKVGRRSVEEDIETVRMLKKMVDGKAVLRLDANRSWGLGEAINFCKAVGSASIEYIEEPLKDVAELARFFEETAMPVALDETIVEQGVERIGKLEAVDAFVLKPGLVGGFDETAELVRFAKENGKKVCLSSTFQSSVTIEAFAAFAAGIGIADMAQGLDTGKWFAEDLFVDPLRISNGAIEISQIPRLASELRMDLLEDVPNG